MVINELKAAIDRFEGNFAVLRYGEGEILWPKDKLFEGAAESDTVVLVLKSDKDATKDREDLAKSLLNEVLKRD